MDDDGEPEAEDAAQARAILDAFDTVDRERIVDELTAAMVELHDVETTTESDADATAEDGANATE
ncbi:hypothetical protein BG842_11775 [Haladaptatus sp. W1]|uniref:hypothetical protein n=1 Tax=Haladaptatus sp. W1 TaxID=1897478 RepID=UPI000849E2FF|nr:hypothetical protein [Haladaptatus sp. W1]ODR80472.1 hypothetical protein BG842_11775 [Haladaptatus sp. W1]